MARLTGVQRGWKGLGTEQLPSPNLRSCREPSQQCPHHGAQGWTVAPVSRAQEVTQGPGGDPGQTLGQKALQPPVLCSARTAATLRTKLQPLLPCVRPSGVCRPVTEGRRAAPRKLPEDWWPHSSGATALVHAGATCCPPGVPLGSLVPGGVSGGGQPAWGLWRVGLIFPVQKRPSLLSPK